MKDLKTGDYAMHHMDGRERGTLVLVTDRNSAGNFGIQYVPNGGSSFSWPASDFRPITCPHLKAVAKLHAANATVARLKFELAAAEFAVKVASEVELVIRETSQAAKSGGGQRARSAKQRG